MGGLSEGFEQSLADPVIQRKTMAERAIDGYIVTA
jgi:hypothetical protein